MEILSVEAGIPFQDFAQRIAGADYNLELRWNFRREVWALNILDADRVQLYSISSLLVGSFPGLTVVHDRNFPLGAFVMVDTAGESVEASLDSLGNRHQLVFLSGEDLLSS